MLSVGAVFHHILLALAVLALGVAAFPVASRIVPAGSERVITVAVLGVAAAVLEALVLGLVGLGADPFALAAAAALTCAATLYALPSPELFMAAELRAWWRGLGTSSRVAITLLAGVVAAVAAWQLRHPSIGFDNSVYHYVEVVGWIHNGRPGSILKLSYDLPFGNYPVTDEVALTWMAGIARSFVPLSLWSWAMFVLLTVATWTTLRNLRVARAAVLLGTAAVVTLPPIVRQLSEPQTDVPALTWLACTAALCTATDRNPLLLAPALVAAGLAVGTKTTPVFLLLAVLAVGFHAARGRVQAIRGWLWTALAAAFWVGGFWYLRNLVQHGTPLWPFSSVPWGDPQPRLFQLVDASLLERPAATLGGRWDGYAENLAGGIALLAGGLLVLVRGTLGAGLSPALRRTLLAAGAVTLVSLLVFAAAPGTGAPRTFTLWFGPFSTLRYVLPTLAAATVAVALASRAGRATRAASLVVLASALVWNMIENAQLGSPYLPRAAVLILGAAAGVAVLGTVTVAWRTLLRRGVRPPSLPRPAVLAGSAVVVGLALAPAADGYLARHGQVRGSTALARDVAAWLASQPRLEGSERKVAFATRAMSVTLAGDHFTNELELLPARANCAEVRRQTRTGLAVVTPPSFLFRFVGVATYRSGRCLRGRPIGYRRGQFTVYLAPNGIAAGARRR